MLVYPNNTQLNFSKGTWLLQGTDSTCYSSGANFNFTTNALTIGTGIIKIHFELPNVAAGYEPIVEYRINDAYYGYTKAIAPIEIKLPVGFKNATTDPFMKNCSSHYIEIWVKSTSFDKQRWTIGDVKNNNVLTVKSIELPDGSSLWDTKPYNLTALAIGSSSSEGWGVLSETNGDRINTDATLSWGVLIGKSLGLNISTVGYGGTGFYKTGNGNAPNIFTYFEYMDNDIKRDWSGIDIALINIGTNDGNLLFDDFINANIFFVKRLREVKPTLNIIFTSPFQTGTRLAEFSRLRSQYQDDDLVHFVDADFSNILQGHHPQIGQYKSLIIPTILPSVAKVIYGNNKEIIIKKTIKDSDPTSHTFYTLK